MTQQPNTPPDNLPLPWVAVAAYTSAKDKSPLHLVGLRELVLWLMQKNLLSFMDASSALHGALCSLGGRLILYVTTQKPGFARAVNDADTFGLLSVPRRVYSRGIGEQSVEKQPMSRLPAGVIPGISAALYYVGKGWGGGSFNESILEDANNPASCLAMTCEQAAEIWGAGFESELDSSRVWTGEQLAAQIAVFKANGVKNFAGRTWVMAGVKEREGRRLVEDYEKSISPKVVSSVFEMGKQVAKKDIKRA